METLIIKYFTRARGRGGFEDQKQGEQTSQGQHHLFLLMTAQCTSVEAFMKTN
jgi:hypothetical protein